jgi:hypothetical protein
MLTSVQWRQKSVALSFGNSGWWRLVMKAESFTDLSRVERKTTQIIGLMLTAVFVGMLALNAFCF